MTTLGKRAIGGDVSIDIDRLVAGRMLIQANSGGGKSWALRKLLEATHGRVQHLVLDVEGEFYTLRERFDYVLAGRDGGDCPAHPRAAALLARRLLELGTSAILDLYELKAHERFAFVRGFLDALVNAPRALWHPALVVVDEAHVFCPESGKSETAASVIDLCTRGRKRGFAAVLATQRLSKLHKDAAAECNSKLIGRCGLDIDMARAGDDLGFHKAARGDLRTLKPGEFFAFGPAFGFDGVSRVEVGAVATSHPRAGARAVPPAPPRAAVQAVLAELADIPAEAEQEARSVEELRRALAERTRERDTALGTAQRLAAGDPDNLEQLRRDAAARADERVGEIAERIRNRAVETVEQLGRDLDCLVRETIDKLCEGFGHDAITVGQLVPGIAGGLNVKRDRVTSDLSRVSYAPARIAGAAPSARSGEARMLSVLAQHFPTGLREGQWAALAGLKRSGGTWSTYKSRLRTAGHLREDGGLYFATEAGVEAAGVVPERPQTVEEVLALWQSKPGMAPVMPLVNAVVWAPSYPVNRAELADAVGLTASGGTFSTYLSRARTAQLIADRDGGLVPGEAFEGLD